MTKDGDVIRLLPRRNYVEEEGMENPFTQTKLQATIFSKFLRENDYHIPVDILIVMGNPRTSIFQEEKKYPMIRYDQLNNYFSKIISKECPLEKYNELIEIGNILKDHHQDRFFEDFNVMHKRFETHNMPLPNFSGNDLKFYEELLECRRKISKLKNIPACNIFHNRDAELLVIYKPTTKEEFVRVPGFKEKKYLLCRWEIIAIIKKYTE